MRRKRAASSTQWTESSGTLSLGLVVLPHPGGLASVVAQLQQRTDLELGPVQGHRVPAVAEVALGQDEEFLQSVQAMSSVLSVDVVFAEVSAEDHS